MTCNFSEEILLVSALPPKLMSGEIRVKNTEKYIENINNNTSIH